MSGDVLGIPVSDELLAQWLRWFAPDPQPLLIQGQGEPTPVVAELRDTYELYGLGDRGLSVAWIGEAEYMALDRRERAALIRSQVSRGRALVPSVRRWGAEAGAAARSQADGHRFLWWPSLLGSANARRIVGRFVAGTRSASLHRAVAPDVWRSLTELLPGAASVAGTWPAGSGPNCFGAVMAAAGVAGAADVWMQRESFEEWLAATARPTATRDVGLAGIVLVWRDTAGLADHAAVTLGSGWALHKASQGWMSPTSVLPVDALVRSVRLKGLRLRRYRIRGDTLTA